MRIIILNCYSRNALAIINSLDKKYELIGGAEKKSDHLLGSPDKFFKSRRLKTIFRYTDPVQNINKFQEDIIIASKKYCADAVIAAGTTITNSLSKVKPVIMHETNAIPLVENYDKLIKVADKWECYQICSQLNIPAPKTVLLENSRHGLAALNSLQFPVIVKPRDSYAAIGVARINSIKEFKLYLNTITSEANPATGGILVQEAIDGELHDVTSCAKNGEPISMLSQQRLMTLYDFGGGGIINKTTKNSVLLDYAEKIIRHMKWNGILEFDFIKTSTGSFYLLECNPKFWGTTQLTVSAGLNMPQQLVDHLYFEKSVSPMQEYKEGLVYKWLFPECVYHWFTKPLTLSHTLRRLLNTLKKYDAKESMHNFTSHNFLHLMGIVMNKTKL